MATESKTTQVATETSTKRVITIITTRGEKVKVNYEGNEWGDLKKILERGGRDADGNNFSGYDLGNMKCVESVKRNTLEHINAIIPDGNFNLFLMPYKSKSGSMSRVEINAAIKELIAKDGDGAKSFFSKDGKNYTQLSSTVLEDLLEKYKPGTKKAVSKAKAEAITDVVTSVKEAKAKGESNDEILANLAGLTQDEKLDLVIQLLLDVKAGNVGVVSPTEATVKVKTQEEIDAENKAAAEATAKAEAEAKAKKEADEKARKEKEEQDKLDKEMSDLIEGFNDVRR